MSLKDHYFLKMKFIIFKINIFYYIKSGFTYISQLIGSTGIKNSLEFFTCIMYYLTCINAVCVIFGHVTHLTIQCFFN